MSSFHGDVIERQPISQALLQVIRQIGECKGKQDLFKNQAPQVLESLRQAAIIFSTESSNRIEGVSAPPKIIKKLVEKKIEPKNRSEQEIAGYRDVLNTIHANFQNIPITTNIVRQLHRDLYQFAARQGGEWKITENTISEKLPDGTERVRFTPVSALNTPEAMETLHGGFNEMWDQGKVDRLLLIPAYVLDFLCIHPFLDGNGRMARLLSILLLYKAGYEVGRYISLERIIERTKEGYYETLYDSSQRWHESKHTLQPFWDYFLGVVLLTAYREFEERVGVLTATKGAKRESVIDAVDHLPDQFQYADLERACPGVSRPTIARALTELRQAGKIRCIKAGRDATWEKININGRLTASS